MRSIDDLDVHGKRVLVNPGKGRSQEVVYRDVATGHHEHDGQEAGDRQGAEREPGAPESPTARSVHRVEEPGDLPRIHRGHDPVEEEGDVGHQQADQHRLVDQERQQVHLVHPEEDPARQGKREQRRGGEGEGAHVGARIRMAEAREQQGQECGAKRGSRAGRPLGCRHRAE